MNIFSGLSEVGDLAVKGCNTIVGYTAAKLNARMLRMLPIPGEQTPEFLKRFYQFRNEQEYYEELSLSIWQGMSIETFRILEESERKKRIDYLLLETHGPDLMG